MAQQQITVVFTDDDGDEFPFTVPAIASVPRAYAEALADEAIEAGAIRPTGDLEFERIEGAA